MLRINTKKNVNFSMMFIIVAVAMYIASRINIEKFIELFAITSLNFTHIFPWRFITYCFYFGESPFFFFFTMLVLFVFATKLESVWGSFYFASFLIMTIVCRSMAAFLFGAELPIIDWTNIYTSLVIAFGFNFAEERLYLFFIIPIKMKILAIIAVVILILSLIGTLLYPMMINFIQSNGSLLPAEYQTLVDEYYHNQMFHQEGLIHISSLISPFLVKIFSYMGLIVFARKVFNIETYPDSDQAKAKAALNDIRNIMTIIAKETEKLNEHKPSDRADDEDDEDDDDDEWPDVGEIISKSSESENNDNQAKSESLCDEEDFDPDDDYCKNCRDFNQCQARYDENNDRVDELV